MLIALLLAAAPVAPVEVVGFSNGDKQVAFVEHGVAEGSGYPWAKLRVFDVAKSADAAPPIDVSLDGGKDSDTEAEAVKQARAKLDGVAKKLGVTAWEPARVIAFDEHGELSDHTGAPIGTIKLDVHGKKAKACDAPMRGALIELRLYAMDDDKPVTIAHEKKPPKDRPCASTCELGGVFAHGKVALVFTRCQVPGGEGSAAKLNAYAAVLHDGLDEPLPPQ